ncbi:MAG: hypothetical protein GEEBNDBF_00274 [bacterium]|nr:hypothetical protein [bacterium]
MQQAPGLTLVALFLWLIPLLTLPHEWRFLRNTPGIPVSQWVLSVSVFVLFAVMDFMLLFHPLFNIIELTSVVMGCLILMILCSLLLMTGRLRLFTRLQAERRAERREVLEGIRDLIDERKREKIRARYGEDSPA